MEGQFSCKIGNFVLLQYKRFIYIDRLSKKSIRVKGFKVYIKGILKIEEKIASKNSKLFQHFQKWDLLKG